MRRSERFSSKTAIRGMQIVDRIVQLFKFIIFLYLIVLTYRPRSSKSAALNTAAVMERDVKRLPNEKKVMLKIDSNSYWHYLIKIVVIISVVGNICLVVFKLGYGLL